MLTLASKQVGETGFGLMGFTARPHKTSDEQAFTAMKAALALGANFWNAGEFYGQPDGRTDNLKLLNRYFTRYPEDADKVVLSVKGAVNLATYTIDASPEGIKKSVENILSILDGKKKLDIFQSARVDKNTPIEDTIRAVAEYVKAGKIGGIGLSEASATTIRRAHAVHPIAGVEVEFSLWATEILQNGVAATCAELDIPIIAYSPLGRGFLTGKIRSSDDIPDGELRKTLDRFQPESFEKNLKLVDEINIISVKKGITSAQLALAWVRHQSQRNGMPVIIPIPGAVKDERVRENMAHVDMTDEEVAEINTILKSIEIVGTRYTQAIESSLFG
ncbi:hypothetical protein Q9L58_004219 [Maublancomyces gigas]|uniref:NADP-dependent oxidoreductase domain-containing protein n=1 Tax=Discina gigas TaxID=1032678 RepID=A0ABR3GLE6_9PEZI